MSGALIKVLTSHQCASGSNPGPSVANFHFVNGRCDLTVNAIIGNQAFQNGRWHICFSSGLDKVETGYNLLME